MRAPMKGQSEALKLEESQEDFQVTADTGMADRRTHLMAKGTVERPPAKSMDLPTDVSIWEPVMPASSRIPTTSEVLLKARESKLPRELEALLVELLTRPIDQSGGHRAGYVVREQEIGQVFAQLDVGVAHALARRLEIARYDDPVATAFNRMVASRRNRLKTFLANARKRAAI